MNTLEYALKKHPIIVSLTDMNDMKKAIDADSSIIIIINADIRTIYQVAKEVQETDKLIFVHVDLMKGLKRDSSGIEYLANHVGIDGIVTTNGNLIQTAKRLRLLTIQRVFILDSASIEQGVKSIRQNHPDAVEILPGIAVPHIMDKIKVTIKPIVIAAGLIDTKDEVQGILQKGAQGISSSAIELWKS